MRVAIIGETISKRTGFGKQTKYLCQGLAAKGHEVHLLGLGGMRDDNVKGFTQWTCTYFDVNEIDNLLGIIKPDVIISFTFLGHQVALVQSVAMACNVPCYFWTPWEGVSLPKDHDKMFPFVPSERFIHLSKYGVNLWKNTIGSEYIYHGIDLDVFKILDKTGLKKKWSKRLKTHFEDTVIMAVDRNDTRKRWDLVFDYMRRLIKAGVSVQLIAVVWPKVFPEMGYDLPNLAKVYGIEDHVIFTDVEGVGEITDADLAELYNMADFRVSMSSGEGFGIGTIEAMACGCVNVCPNNTTFQEIAGPACVPDAACDTKLECLWSIPDVRAMAERTIQYLKEPEEYAKVRNWGLHEISVFNVKTMIDKWDEVLKRKIDKDPWYTNRFGFVKSGLRLNQLQVWCNVLKALAGDNMCLQLFSFDGKFIDFARAYGVKLVGMESDPKCVELMSNEAKTFTMHEDIKGPWPKAGCLVAIDCLDYMPEEVRPDFLRRMTGYQWSLVRFNKTHKFDQTHTVSGDAEKIMTDFGLVRRPDLEKMMSDKLKLADLGGAQIWQNHTDTSLIPVGFRQ